MKICSKKTCKFKGVYQPLENFAPHERTFDGKRCECKTCQKETKNKHRQTIMEDAKYLSQFSPV